MDNSDPLRNVGFAKTDNNAAGRRLVDVVGGNGFRTGRPPAQDITVIGYPALSPYPGNRRHSCRGRTSVFNDDRIVVNCRLTAGLNGGSGVTEFNSGRGTGYINGTSIGRDATRWASPYFDEFGWDLYVYADNL
ncbi:hypothetical protein [Sinosporangium siamense]|uniref:Uncharacterized protein n=1 Tax=Sinosporangium siamense TaxID=1367973 RepID=A0A919RFR9_9ACTN|nr:hypothetical protein [Sinosporangium siamense]GII93081.1 hypothetical protein Ssi02_33120 [Sinosporangium siamense]